MIAIARAKELAMDGLQEEENMDKQLNKKETVALKQNAEKEFHLDKKSEKYKK